MRTLYGLMTLFVLFFVGIGSSYALTYEGVLRVVDIDDHSVTLSWDADASSMGYIVYYDYTDALDAESPQYFQESDPTTDTMIEVEGLEASTKYSFVVVSLDAEGNESENMSNQITLKTYRERPIFGLSDRPIVTPEARSLILPFTHVLGMDVINAAEIHVYDVEREAEIFVKGYLNNAKTDLRDLQVYLSTPLKDQRQYRVEVISMENMDGEGIEEGAVTVREFVASLPEPGPEPTPTPTTDTNPDTGSNEPASEPEPEPEEKKPVPIDRLPDTGPKEILPVIAALIILLAGFMLLKYRRS